MTLLQIIRLLRDPELWEHANGLIPGELIIKRGSLRFYSQSAYHFRRGKEIIYTPNTLTRNLIIKPLAKKLIKQLRVTQ